MPRGKCMKRVLTPVQLIEHSIITKYRNTIWSKFVRSCEDYELIEPNDKIAVCISGGKDSMLLAKCMQELQAHGKIPFEATFICMDPGYNEENRALIEKNASEMNIPIHFFQAPIFSYVKTQCDNACYICAKMRRGYLYKEAQSLGCNKIALGHHYNDVIETTILGMFYSSEISAMRPKLPSKNYPGMELIRPLFLIKEADIIAWANHNDLKFLACACPLSNFHNREAFSKRKEIKEIIKELQKTIPEVEDSIFRSIHNVNYNTMVGYRLGEEKHSFLENYQKERK